MKSLLILLASIAVTAVAVAGQPAQSPPLAANADATEARIAAEVGPLMRAWARSEAGYQTNLGEIGGDLHRAFPGVKPGSQSDAVVFLALMEKQRSLQSAITKLQGARALSSDQQSQLRQARAQRDQVDAMISNLLKSLDDTADAVIKP